MGVSKVIYGSETVMDISDSTVTAETLYEGTVAYGADGERIIGTMTYSRLNLLDNSDFTNPVDQRNGDALTATLTSNQGYGIDRWYYYGAQGTKATDGIDFTILTNGIIWQYLETEQEGKTLTAVVELADGSRIVGSGVVPAFSGSTVGIIRIPVNSSGRRVDVNLSNQGKIQFVITIGSGSMKIANCALYVGQYTEATAPAYQPKGYAAELAECQRYYLPVAKASGQYLTAHFTHSGRCSIITPALPMRVTPSIMTFGGSAQVYVPATGWRDISPFIETAAHSPMQGNAYQVVFDTINGLTSGNSYIVRNIKALSADI